MAWEAGPWGMFRRFRELFGVIHNEDGKITSSPDTNFVNGLLCVWCNSVWFGTLLALIWVFFPSVAVWVLPLALSTSSVIVNRLVSKE